MAVDDTKLEFSTTWDIDQLIASGTVTVGSGDSAIYTFSDINYPPIFELSAQPNSSGAWYQPGQNGAQTGAVFSFNAYISGTTIRCITNKPATIRYYVWSDKVTY